jgi:hypothetical protein
MLFAYIPGKLSIIGEVKDWKVLYAFRGFYTVTKHAGAVIYNKGLN